MARTPAPFYANDHYCTIPDQMKKALFRSTIYCFTLLTACVASQSLQAGEIELANWKVDYRKALDRLELAYSRATAKGHLNRVADIQSGSSYAVTISTYDGLQKATMSIDRIDSGKRIPEYEFNYVLGRETAFEVQRTDNKSGRYFINKIASKDDVARRETYRKIVNDFTTTGGRFLFAVFRSGWFKTKDLLDDQKYKVFSAEKIVVSGENLMRLRFASADHTKSQVKGEIDLLTDRCWAIRRGQVDMSALGAFFEEEVQQQLKVTMTVDYAEDQLGVPVPSRVTFANGMGKMSCEFEEFRLGTQILERDFTLNFFGLRDLKAPVVSTSPWRFVYWLLGMAIVALIGSLVVRKLKF